MTPSPPSPHPYISSLCVYSPLPGRFLFTLPPRLPRTGCHGSYQRWRLSLVKGYRMNGSSPLQEFPATVHSGRHGKTNNVGPLRGRVWGNTNKWREIQLVKNWKTHTKKLKIKKKTTATHGLTLSDVVPRPLVVPEEGMPLDFVHAVSAQSHLSAERGVHSSGIR